ncbi:acetyl-CoA C-acyltransferase FadA [Larsenimonas rhizosphaerae]|uniref:acetyl-CoA C-acyltransferase FadA n=1 Tax=Larsenimonas rhizosphaerae TaxID=2944682 RepID=UPI00203471EE|nr:acetyl-CoA C-acyltransferase FadA [Larsenimonas rhizosphaerae]MCM2131173.1 acetyl-CoA C-acyltransferase FadA [Larsenimonas rhizosphaerae]
MRFNEDDVVIVDALRTAMGKARDGGFRHVRAENLSASVMEGLISRHEAFDPAALDDVIWGCVNQTLEQGFNVARNAALMTSIPPTVPAQTVNRLCGSSMTALHSAYANIRAGLGQQYLVGGVEHMGHIEMAHGVDVNPAISQHTAKAAMMMGLTAELLGKLHGIDRASQDAFGVRSHQRAARARRDGHFDDEIIGVEGHDSQGRRVLINRDEVIRDDANMEDMARLSPVFDPRNGTVTAGTSSALSVGASGLLVMRYSQAHALGLEPLARVISVGVSGCDASIMGFGPVEATRKALQAANLGVRDLDVIELNEAFAAQSLPVLQALELDEVMDEKVNLFGGAIALGHPLGCSGTRICTTLLNVMRHRQATLGLATMCIGMGQGVATIFERV